MYLIPIQLIRVYLVDSFVGNSRRIRIIIIIIIIIISHTFEGSISDYFSFARGFKRVIGVCTPGIIKPAALLHIILACRDKYMNIYVYEFSISFI